ncbi:unnamed protein product [Urochloa humidicola]
MVLPLAQPQPPEGRTLPRRQCLSPRCAPPASPSINDLVASTREAIATSPPTVRAPPSSPSPRKPAPAPARWIRLSLSRIGGGRSHSGGRDGPLGAQGGGTGRAAVPCAAPVLPPLLHRCQSRGLPPTSPRGSAAAPPPCRSRDSRSRGGLTAGRCPLRGDDDGKVHQVSVQAMSGAASAGVEPVGRRRLVGQGLPALVSYTLSFPFPLS